MLRRAHRPKTFRVRLHRGLSFAPKVQLQHAKGGDSSAHVDEKGSSHAATIFFAFPRRISIALVRCKQVPQRDCAWCKLVLRTVLPVYGVLVLFLSVVPASVSTRPQACNMYGATRAEFLASCLVPHGGIRQDRSSKALLI